MFFDAAKAFDRVSHWTLFSKMIKRNVSLVIVRIIAYWYQTQTMCVKWGKFNSGTLMFQMVYAKVGYCHQNYLLYMLMICHMN